MFTYAIIALLVSYTTAGDEKYSPEECYTNLIATRVAEQEEVFTINLRRGGKLPVGIRIRVDDINGPYRVSATRKDGRVLSEATFATPGEMEFDSRFPVASVVVTYRPEILNVFSDVPYNPAKASILSVYVNGCYDYKYGQK